MVIDRMIAAFDMWRERRRFKRRIARYRQRKLERQLDGLTDHDLLSRICGDGRD